MAHIIMLTWNALDYTQKCIDSMVPGLRKNDILTIVDNGSNKDTVQYLNSLRLRYGVKHNRFKINIIFNQENMGFVHAVNQAVSSQQIQDTILLNNDLDEFPNDWLDTLYNESISLDNAGIVGVKQSAYTPDGRRLLAHYGAFTLPETMQGWPYHGGQQDLGQCSEPRIVDHVNFAMVYIKQDVIEKLLIKDGFFLDPSIFSYGEDDDCCLRTRLLGYNVWVTPAIDIIHYTNISTRVNNVSQEDMHTKSLRVYKKKWKSYYDEKYKAELNFHSLAAFPTGYATSGRQIIRNLDDLGVKINYSFVYGTKYSEPPIIDDSKAEVIRQTRPIRPGGIQLLFGQGDVMNKNSGDYKIGFTMLETDTLPQEWVEQLNCMDEVWVPSNFNKETFSKSGVTKPIYVMPLGIDVNYFHPNMKPLTYKKTMPFNFLSVGEWGERKNFLTLIQSFRIGFSGERKYSTGLTIRYTNNDYGITPPIMQQVSQLTFIHDSAHVRFIKDDCQEKNGNQKIESYKMGCLYRSAQCYVSSTSGEGFGLPIIEALACGLPVIVTGWSSFVEHLQNESGEPLPGVHFVNYKLDTPAAKCPYYIPTSKWARIDVKDLAAKMIYVRDNYEEEKQNALETSKIIRERFSWKTSCARMRDRILEIKELIK